MREDVPTGSTPRKRSWDIVDTWSLTNRDTVLDEFRRRDVSSSNSDEFVSEDFALPSLPDSISERGGGSEIESIAEEDEDFEMEGQDDTIKVASPIQAEVKSLASSTSSSTSSSSSSSSGSIVPNPPTLLKRPQSTLKSGLPTRGTLTERPTNLLGLRVTTRRMTRR